MAVDCAIGRVRCEDCGPSLISGPDKVSVFFDGEDFCAITKCGFCGRVVYLQIDKTTAENFARDGVKVFSWITGQQIMKDE